MIDSSALPQLLVYGILLFAAFIFIRRVIQFLKGENGCGQCDSGCSHSGGACRFKETSDMGSDASHPPEENTKTELKVIQRLK